MNQGLKILLEGDGFRQFHAKSNKFVRRVESSEVLAFRHHVWLHKNGGQAEAYNDKSGERLGRLELWRSMDDLKTFFKEFQ